MTFLIKRTVRKNQGGDPGDVRRTVRFVRKTWSPNNPAKPKLTLRQVRVIRKSGKSQRALAARFNVAHTTIGDIRRGVTWKHI